MTLHSVVFYSESTLCLLTFPFFLWILSHFFDGSYPFEIRQIGHSIYVTRIRNSHLTRDPQFRIKFFLVESNLYTIWIGSLSNVRDPMIFDIQITTTDDTNGSETGYLCAPGDVPSKFTLAQWVV